MHDGRVRALFTDYLGQGVVIEHDRSSANPDMAISIYAHVKPLDGVLPGVNVKEGDIIARIADTGRSRTNILPHLHFSIGRSSADMGYEPFVWNHMRYPGLVTLNNPQDHLDWPVELLGP